MVATTQFPPNTWTVSLAGAFGLTVGLTYFGSFFLVPLTGNQVLLPLSVPLRRDLWAP
jgi:glutamate synthase (NADPH) small chain